MYPQFERKRAQFAVERLEDRQLLVGTHVANFFPTTSISPSNLLLPVASGTTITTSGQVFSPGTDSSNKSNPIPTGNVIVQWYGGAVVATIPLAANSTPDDPIYSGFGIWTNVNLTLNYRDAGTIVPSGRYLGHHVLTFQYTGDEFYAPSHLYDSTDFQSVINGIRDGFVTNLLPDATKQDHLAFIHSPDNTATNSTMNPPVTVQALDESGVPDTTAAGEVSLTLTGGDPAAHLLGETTSFFVNGVATFSSLKIDKPGEYQVIANSGSLTPIYSSPFKVADGVLKFIKRPMGGDAGAPIKPAIVVALQDAKGKTITSDSTTVVQLDPVGFAGGNPITGNIATLVNGVATFDNVVLKKAGFYQLRASDGAHTEATSKKFKIGGDKLVVKKLQTDVNVNDFIPMTIGIVNSKGKPDTNATSLVRVTLNPTVPDNGAQLSGAVVAMFSDGLAVFEPGFGFSINKPGNYTLTVTEVEDVSGSLVPTETTTPIVTKKITVGGFHLVFAPQPKSTDVNSPINFTVTLKTRKNKTVTTDDANGISIDVARLDSDKPFEATGEGSVLMTNGSVTWGSGLPLTLDTAGLYQIIAVEVDPQGNVIEHTAGASSKPFKVNGLHLEFSIRSYSVDVGTQVIFTVSVKNSKKKIVTSEDGKVLRLSSLMDDGSANPNPVDFANRVIQSGVVSWAADLDNDVSFVHVGKYRLLVEEVDETATPIPWTVSALSKSIKVSGFHLEFITPLKTTPINTPILFSVAVKNSKRKTVSVEDGRHVVADLIAVVGSNTPPPSFQIVPTIQNGIATFDSTAVVMATVTGVYRIYVHETDDDQSTHDVEYTAPALSKKIQCP